MTTAQLGDHVQVHYVKRFQDGSVVRSPSDRPLPLTVGVFHPRLPGLGGLLAGLELGGSITLQVSPDNAYGRADPTRVRRLSRTRFRREESLVKGKWVRIQTSSGKSRRVRILSFDDRMVVVDTNHRWAGQKMELEVQLHAIRASGAARDL